MITKYVVFDLEFTKLVNGVDEDLHIACASTFASCDKIAYLWYSNTDTTISEYMNKATLFKFANYLHAMDAAGYTIITWGGTATDFRILVKEIPEYAKLLVQLCLKHIDIPFCAASHIGMMMGLSATCKGLGFDEKMNSSKDIPNLWQMDKQKVLAHVQTDATLTMQVLESILTTNCIKWFTQKGTIRVWSPCKLLNVSTCLLMPLPAVPFPIADSMNPKITSKWMFERKDI